MTLRLCKIIIIMLSDKVRNGKTNNYRYTLYTMHLLIFV